MLAVKGFRHEHLDVVANHLVDAVAEQPFTGRIEGENKPLGIDQNDAIDSGFHQGVKSPLGEAHVLGSCVWAAA